MTVPVPVREEAAQVGPVAPPAGMEGERGPLLRLVRDQRIAFLGVGVANTIIGGFWFVFLELAVGHVVGYLVVLLAAHVASVVSAFILYRRVVFRVRRHVWRDLARFELVYVSALGVNLVLLPLLVEVAGLPVIPAQFLVVGVTAVMSFFGHKHFSFRRRGRSAR